MNNVIPRRPAGHAPLSPAQHDMLGTSQHVPVVLHVPGPLDVDALRRALDNLVARHEILRTHYGDGTAQHVAAVGPAALRVVDVYHLPSAQRWDEAMRLAAAEIATPFDLAVGPVFRALLIALGTESPGHVLVLTTHHIAADAWSRTVLLRELDELYGTTGHRSTLAPLPIQYADYAYWQHKRMSGSVARPSPSRQGNRVRRALTPELAAQIRALATDSGVTVHTVPLAAFATVLWHYYGQQRFVIGSVLTGRDVPETEPLIGLFAHTVAVPVDLSDEPPFMDLLRRTHGSVPDTSGYQVRYEYAESSVGELSCLGAEVIDIADQTAVVDLALTASGTDLELTYATDVFTQATAELLLGYVVDVLEHVVAQPESIATSPAASNLTAPKPTKADPATPEAAPTTPRGRPDSNLPVVKGQMGGYSRVVDNKSSVHNLAGSAHPRGLSVVDAMPEGGDPVDEYPLSPLQTGMVFHSLFDPESTDYVVQSVYRIEGKLDVALLRRALEHVVERHPVLRTTFAWDGHPVQRVQRSAPVRLRELDWRDIPVVDVPARLASHLVAERARGVDLARTPPHRFDLARLADRSYRLIWHGHHALLDGWSAQLVLDEVRTIYRSLRGTDALPALPEPVPFRRYIDWLGRHDPADATAYWQRMLGDLTTPTRLPILAPERGDGRGTSNQEVRTLTDRVPAELAEQLRQLAQRHRITIESIVHAAWGLLLRRYAGVDDVTFGSTTSDRSANPRTVGLLINTMPVRLRVPADATVADWLREVHEQLVRDVEHCSLVDVQRQSRVPAGQRLFETILSYESFPRVGPADHDGLTIAPVQTWAQTGYPLVLNVRHDDLRFRLDYQPGRIQPDAAERLMAHFRMLLELLATRPDRRIADLAPLPAVEWRQVVHTFNDTVQRYPADRCLHELFEAQADRTPLAVAVRFRKESVTYRELDERANRVAQHLRAVGVGAESLVGICVERGVDLAVAVLAVLKAGGAFVLDPLVDTAFVLTQTALVDRVTGDGVVCLDSDEVDRCSSSRVSGVVTPDNLAGSMVRHRGMVNHVSWLASNYPLAPGDKVLQLDTSVWDMFWPWSRGAAVVLARPDGHREPQYVVQTLMREAITAVHLAPAMVRAVLPLLEGQRLPLRWLFTGALRPEVLRECDKRCPQTEVVSLYGANEVTATAWSADASAGRVSVGRPIANTQVHVLDKAGEPVPIGVPGAAVLAGDGVGRGYYGRPALTARRFVPDPFGPPGSRCYRTGDLMRWLPDGTLEFLGRLDEQVTIRGFRVELGEIEAVLAAHPRLAHAVVVADGERLVAYLVPKGDKAPTTSELRAHIQSRLPDHLVPAAFVVLDWLPVNSDGSVDHAALPAADVPAFAAPGTPVEEAIADVWREVLRIPEVGVHDNFFALGGDSILSIQVMVVARRAGLELTPRQLFANPTIADLAAALDKPAEPVIVQAEQGTVAGDVPLTPIQRWFTLLDAPRDHYLQTVRLRWHEPVVPESLRRALDSVVTHHDALRSRLVRTRTGEWHQYIAAYEPGDLLRVVDTPDELNLSDGPLLRAQLVKFTDGRPDELIIKVHQLAIDALSWHILLDDLATAYRQYHAGEPCWLPAKTTSFRHWAGRLADHATSADFAPEAAYWQQPRPLPHPFPVDHPNGRNTEGSTATVTRALDPRQAETLLAQRTQINELLVTALAQTLSDHMGRSRVDIDLESHGREPLFDDVDLSRTVGWFTSIHPLHIRLPDSLDPVRSMKIVREHLRHTPNHGIGHGIVQYLHPSPPNHLPAAVRFHYHGQSHTARDTGQFTQVSFDVDRSPDGIRPYLLDVNAVVVDGEFQVHWTYSANVHRASTMESLANDFLSNLTALLAAREPVVVPERAFLDRLTPGAPSTLLRLGRHGVPGVSIALVADGAVVDAWGEGVASVDGGVPVRPDTVFRAGSLGDHVTTLAVLRLARDGVLKLDERMRQLLAGEDFALVEQLLSDALGLPFPELMRELVFAPLGMRDSGYGSAFTDSRVDRIAMGHGATVPAAAGGLWTTAFDLAQVAAEIGRAHVGGGAVLDRWSVDQLLAGLGTVVRSSGGVRWYGHAGEVSGYRSYSAVGLESGAGVVILANGATGHEFVTDLLVELGLGVRVWVDRGSA
jgi:non-ribosomal peptide synthase protein (TIGR01720 family)